MPFDNLNPRTANTDPVIKYKKKIKRRSSRIPVILAIVFGSGFLGNIVFGDKSIAWLIASPEERAEMDAIKAMLTHITFFHVACTDQSATTEYHQNWMNYAAQKGWAAYAPSGPTCVNPNVHVSFAHIVAFTVGCPTIALGAADQQRWTTYAAQKGWGPYTQAGAACVDP